ncbi:MAG: bifunctional precorrin-2 dehydrogenase/sirohydrochlorin ferrochelatase [Rikenellaceae bacterium]|nr:bifunctional precorrin-2 dehydrogenase/sirohydrochlorin ferrochelatase [Rikenellaceae bacterium]
MKFLPISVNIDEKKIVMIGGGNVALHKASILARFTDKATIVSPEFLDGFHELPFDLVRKRFSPEDLDGAFLVYVCTGDSSLNSEIKYECESRGILTSVCDNPALCDFISPAIYKNRNMTIAIGSDSEDVKRSIRVRNSVKDAVENNLIDIG